MPRYMLLLHDDRQELLKMSPDEMQKAIEKYVAWKTKLNNLGILAGSEKLVDDSGKVIRGGKGQMRVTDGPYSETKEVMGGYFTIEAASYQEAIDRCEDCPHLEYAGTIELRMVDEMVPQS
jgi:hypothetical protein